jgi:hypothetical protein
MEGLTLVGLFMEGTTLTCLETYFDAKKRTLMPTWLVSPSIVTFHQFPTWSKINAVPPKCGRAYTPTRQGEIGQCKSVYVYQSQFYLVDDRRVEA